MSTTASLLLNHLIRKYSSVQWQQPTIKGGLAPHKLKYIQEWIEDHLDQALTLSDLANVVNLSEYHFAHMFKQSMNMAPHQYVMQRQQQGQGANSVISAFFARYCPSMWV